MTSVKHVLESIFGSSVDAYYTPKGGLNSANLSLQLGATGLALWSENSNNEIANASAILAGGAAFAVGGALLAKEISSGDNWFEIASTAFGEVGDLCIVLGAVAKGLDSPALSAIGSAIEYTGQAAIVADLIVTSDGAFQNWSISSPAFLNFTNNIISDFDKINDLESDLGQDFQSIKGAVSNAWGSFAPLMSNLLSETNTVADDISSANLDADATSLSSDFSGLTSSLTGVVQSDNLTLSPLSELADGNIETISSEGNTLSFDGITTNSLGSTLSLGVEAGTGGTLAPTETYTFNSSAGIVQSTDQENTDDTSKITTYNSDGSSATTYYSGPNGTGSVTEIDQENDDCTSQITTYDANGNQTSTSYGGPNGSGEIMSVTITSSAAAIFQTISTVKYMYSGSGISGSLVYAPTAAGGGPLLEDVSLDGGGISFFYPAEEATFDVNANGAVMEWSLSAGASDGTGYASLIGHDPDAAGQVGLSPAPSSLYNVIEYYVDDGQQEAYYNPNSSGSWSVDLASIMTNLTVSTYSGKMLELSSLLKNKNLSTQGSVDDLTISGAGTVELKGTANLPLVLVDGSATFALHGGILNTDPITVSAGAMISGYGTIDGSDIVNGKMIAEGGVLDLTGSIGGSGQIQIKTGSTLLLNDTANTTIGLSTLNDGVIRNKSTALVTIGGPVSGTGTIDLEKGLLTIDGNVGKSQQVSFTGSGETLVLGDIETFDADIRNFKSGDTIDLTNISFSDIEATHFANGVLTLTEVGGPIKLTFASPASFSGKTIVDFQDGSGVGIMLSANAQTILIDDAKIAMSGTDLAGFGIRPLSIADSMMMGSTSLLSSAITLQG